MKKKLLLLLIAAMPLYAIAQTSRIAIPSGTIHPQAGIRDVRPTAADLVEGRFYRYIQFFSIPTEVQKAKLTAAGIRLLEYLPEATYVASIPAVATAALSDTNIRSVLPVLYTGKLDPSLAAKKYPKWATRGAGRIEVTVLHYSDISSDAASALLTARGFNPTHSSPELHAHRLIIRTADLQRLAAIPAVAYIEPMNAEPQPENLWGRTDHRVNTLSTEYSTGLHYDGTGVRVALNDDGVIGPHIDHTGRIISQYITFNNGDHGDHCAGTIFGAGNRNPTTRGMASGAQLGVYGVSGSFASTYQAFDSIYNHYTALGTRITSTSYSDGNNTGYTTRARMMDIQINDMPQLMHVFSSGNAGTSDFGWGAGAGWANVTGGHKQAKNVITVGNLTYQDVINSSSSRGPAKDGRIKPDVCAVGTDVNSTIAGNIYDVYTGTSMSCPGVSGTLAVLYHAYKTLNGGVNPPSSLIKAAVMNTADDLGNPGPDYRYGYGRINARRAYGILQSNQYRFDSVTQGATKTHTIAVPTGVSELRVMLYWHDKPAVAGATKALINNLNASLLTPAAATVLPWILNPANNATAVNQTAVQGIDTLNNVEQITIPAPAAGNYTLNVAGFAVPQGPQQYVVVYEFVTDAPVLTYPIGGESIVTATQETIRWDAYGTNGTFTLQYSTNNGTSWSTIATNIAATQRYYNWTPPSIVTGQALVRVTRGSQTSTSAAPFSIIGMPSNLVVNWVCTDSMSVSYSAVPGAIGYVVSVLGTQYMDSAAYSTTTTCIVRNLNTAAAGWFSVHAVATNNCKGRRALAQPYVAAPFNCTLASDVTITAASSPLPNTYVSCDGGTETEFVSIAVKNNGPGQANSTVLKYSVNGSTPVSETLPQLASGATVNYSFVQPYTFLQPGLYTITAWAENAMDPIHANDSFSWIKVYHAPQPGTMPFSENFETFALCDTTANCEVTSCLLNNGWYNAAGASDDEIDWRVHSGPTPSRAQGELTGPQMDYSPGNADGKYLYLESSACGNRTASLISPCLNLAGLSTPQLRLAWHLYGDQGSLHVDVLADGTWVDDVYIVAGNQGDGWQSRTVDLSAFMGKIVSLRIRGITGNSLSDMAIDDIRVYNSLGVTSRLSSLASLQVSPNPSQQNFSVAINGATDGAAFLTLSDAAGRVVLQQSLAIKGGIGNTVLPSSGMPAGVYLLTVKGSGFTLQKKLVKL